MTTDELIGYLVIGFAISGTFIGLPLAALAIWAVANGH